MKIAIVSTRGIPNRYGGFERFAEKLSAELVRRGHHVTVYSPSYHPYREAEYRGVRIRRIYSPEPWMGSSVGSFVYDYLSLRDALKTDELDVLYIAGYTSIVPALRLLHARERRRPVIVTNMDGLEFRRGKYHGMARRYLRWAERQAVAISPYLIADNMGIRDYYKEKYGKESTFIPYGADIPTSFDEGVLKEFGLSPREYYLVIARLEPENNIWMIIKGFMLSDEKDRRPLVIVGKTDTPYARELLRQFGCERCIRFVDGNYNEDTLNALRHYCKVYFHGHSVGGTNPSLLEAMAAGCFIFAHENVFNQSVLGEHAFFFPDALRISTLLTFADTLVEQVREPMTAANLQAVRERYSWNHIADAYERYFHSIIKRTHDE